jgi:hypothetical protein
MSMELTQDTFQQVMNAPHQPLVVIAAVTKDSKDTVVRKFGDFGKMWNVRKGQQDSVFKDVVFTWMDAEKWANWLKSMYGIKTEADSEPTIVVADHAVSVFLLFLDDMRARQKLSVVRNSGCFITMRIRTASRSNSRFTASRLLSMAF